MKVYLHDIPLTEAKRVFNQALKKAGIWGVLDIEAIPLDEQALGRVLAKPVWAIISSPHYHAAAMDGFAVRSSDTIGAMTTSPVDLKCTKADSSNRTLYIDTGDPLPDWADAVIPIEEVETLDQNGKPSIDPRRPHQIRIRAAVTPWSHIRTLGEDIVSGQLLLPAGHVLRPVDLGAIAACGHSQIHVSRKPRIAIIPTGSELIPIGSEVRKGDIIEFNSMVMAAQVQFWGGIANRLPIIPDVLKDIQMVVAESAREYDLVLLNAGSSAGSEDYSAQIVESLGELLVHGIAIRPGHPVILGMIDTLRSGTSQKIPIIGVPGYPVSAALTGEVFVEPLISVWLGKRPHKPEQITAVMTRKVTSPAGDDDYLRVAVGRVGDKILAAPLPRGSGVTTSLVQADGITILPKGVQGVQAGAEVRVRLYRSLSEIENTIFAIGSHDMSLDILAQFLSSRERRLASSNVGSLAGLVALKRGEAHIAGSHLMDPDTGEYNISYVREYLSGRKVVILGLVARQQGLMVANGNPKNIGSLKDLSRSEIVFINRQRGAGTRVLFDFHIQRLGISSEIIKGYANEEYTHLAVAAAISSGRADCGLGIAAAASSLGLEFIPIFEEDYDLIIPEDIYQSDLLAPLLEVLMDPIFHESVSQLPGYNVERMGKIVKIIE